VGLTVQGSGSRVSGLGDRFLGIGVRVRVDDSRFAGLMGRIRCPIKIVYPGKR